MSSCLATPAMVWSWSVTRRAAFSLNSGVYFLLGVLMEGSFGGSISLRSMSTL